MKIKIKCISIVLLSVFLLILFIEPYFTKYKVLAQRNLVKCGDIIDGEFTKKEELSSYTIRLEAGDQIIVYAEPLGSTLILGMALYNPVGEALASSADSPGKFYKGDSGGWAFLSDRPTIKTDTLSGRGDYRLSIANAQFWVNDQKNFGFKLGGIGQFSIYIGCTLRDGTVVNPGDNLQPTVSAPVGGSQPATITNGFSGLAPIDLTQIDTARVPRSGEVEDEIAPTAISPSVFIFESNEGQQYDLTFSRLSGNLNLGLVIVDEGNKTYFVSTLIAATETNSKLTLPAGKYRLAVFKLDLVPPTTPEVTVFAITLK